MNLRPAHGEYNPYYEDYIRLVPEGSVLEHLAAELDRTRAFLSSLSDAQSARRYAEGKWSIKEVVGHLCDTERVMAYRALRIARGDSTPLPGFDQDVFVRGAAFDSVPLAQLIEDYSAVRRATLSLFHGLPQEAWTRQGTASDSIVTVRALAYIIAGHELHHLRIIRDRYLA